MKSHNQTLKRLIKEHDDLPAFHAAYLVFTFLAAILFNMGVFAMLIAAHMGLDIVKYRELNARSWKQTAEGTLRENLLDITLLVAGVTFGVYLHVSLPMIAGLRGLAKAEVSLLSAFFNLVPKIEILHRSLKILSHLEHYLAHVHPQLGKSWTLLEKFFFVCIALFSALLIFSTHILAIDAAHLGSILADELIPWRF